MLDNNNDPQREQMTDTRSREEAEETMDRLVRADLPSDLESLTDLIDRLDRMSFMRALTQRHPPHA
jgi:hypothetical protein